MFVHSNNYFDYLLILYHDRTTYILNTVYILKTEYYCRAESHEYSFLFKTVITILGLFPHNYYVCNVKTRNKQSVWFVKLVGSSLPSP